MIRNLPDLEAMRRFGIAIARGLQSGDVVALSGELGVGKSTLARAIIAACGHGGEVPSPTFTVLEPYPDCSPPLVHADFYRLEDPAEAVELGLDDYRDSAALIAEWPEKAGGFAGEARCLSIRLAISGSGREAIVQGGSDWQGRLP